MEISVDCYDGKTSKKQRLLLKFEGKDVVILISDQGEQSYLIQELVVSRRLGGTPGPPQ